jgi:VIT1/CCC1 family predicted Fe2+/Mn2+ transporter
MDTNKIEKSINELEETSRKLKKYSDIYSELNDIKNLILAYTKKLSDVSNIINESNNSLKLSNKEFISSIEQIHRLISDSEKHHKKVQDLNEKLISENRRYRRDLDNLISSELKQHKTAVEDIVKGVKSEIVNSVNQNSKDQIESLQSTVINKLEQSNNKSKRNSIIIIILLVLNLTVLIGAIGYFYK